MESNEIMINDTNEIQSKPEITITTQETTNNEQKTNVIDSKPEVEKLANNGVKNDVKRDSSYSSYLPSDAYIIKGDDQDDFDPNE